MTISDVNDNAWMTMAPALTPPIRRGEIPPFHKLDEYTFQDLCRDLFGRELSIDHCADYGVRGQGQYGIDLEGICRDPRELEVGQVKRFRRLTDKDIRKASDKFFEHIGHWRKRGVKRFVLMASCRANTVQCREEINKQRRRFARSNIVYECWDSLRIRHKLRPHREIVGEYLEPVWIEKICGPATGGSGAQSYATGGAKIVALELGTKIEKLATRISSNTESQLEVQRETWRKGDSAAALRWVQHIRSDPESWDALEDRVKAKILRFQVGLLLSEADKLVDADCLLDEATVLDPVADLRRARAQLAYLRSGHEAAITELGSASDADDLNFKAAVFLEMGNANHSAQLLSKADRSNPDGLRVRALARTALRDFEGALRDVETALDVQPDWVAIRRARATILYYSTIYSPAPTGTIEAWPEPVSWELVQQDPAAITRMREAEGLFRSFEKIVGLDHNERKRDAIWRLACLAIDPGRQDEAERYCSQILEREPTDYRALSWAFTRSYNFDVKESIRSLSDAISRGVASVEQIVGLTAAYVFSKSLTEALELLNRTKRHFKDAKERTLWALWRSQALVLSDQPEEALKLINRSPHKSELRHVKSLAIAAIAQKTDNWKSLANYLKDAFSETRDAKFLVQLAQLLSAHGEWQRISDNAAELASTFEGGEGFRLAQYGLFNSGHYEECLRYIDNRAESGGEAALTGEMRRLRYACLRELGDLTEAIQRAEQLVKDDPTVANSLQLAQTYFTAGDLFGVARVSQVLLESKEVGAESAIRLANITKDTNASLAKSLWRYAIKQSLTDDLVGPAVSLAFALGLDHETAPLLRRMQELGAAGSQHIRAFNIRDAVDFAQKNQKQFFRLASQYESGSVPVHMLVRGEFLSFPNLYHNIPGANEENGRPDQGPILLFRYGGREIPNQLIRLPDNPRLTIDLTTLLLAAHFDFLKIIEKNFRSIRIPHDLVPALIQMRHGAAPHQPSRFEDIRSMLRLVEEKKIHVIDIPSRDEGAASNFAKQVDPELSYFSELARAGRGYVLCFLPIRRKDSLDALAEVPGRFKPHLVNCVAILNALKQDAAISERIYQHAFTNLGNETRRLGPQHLSAGTDLFCCSVTAETLAGAGILKRVCAKFRVRISQAEYDRLLSEIRAYELSQSTTNWLGNLIAHCHSQIASGKYKVLPALGRIGSSDTFERPEERCLAGFVRAERGAEDIFVSDDRGVNRYFSVENAPLLSAVELLKALVDKRTLARKTYVEILHRLRNSNVRFIQITGEEIASRLAQARVKLGKLVETEAPISIRRYLSACMLRFDILQKPDPSLPPIQARGELVFFLSIVHATYDALVLIWSSGQSNELTRRAQSDWLLENLFIDVAGARQIAHLSQSTDDPTHLTATSIARLFIQAMPIASRLRGRGTERRNQYATWLWQSPLVQRLKYEAKLRTEVCAVLADSVRGLGADQPPSRQTRAISMLIGREFYNDLPEILREEMHADADFMATIGMENLSVVDFKGQIEVDPDEFWSAAAATLTGRPQTVRSPNGLKSATISSDEADGVLVIRVRVEGQTHAFSVADKAHGLLRKDPAGWLAYLLDYRRKLDLSVVDVKKVHRSLSEMTAASDRMALLHTLQQHSTVLWYDHLHSVLRRQFSFEELIPKDFNRLPAHLRIEGQLGRGDFPKLVSKAFERVAKEFGILEAVLRFSGLPIELPIAIVRQIQLMRENRQKQLVRDWLKIATSPISRAHLIRALSACEAPALRRLARRLLLQMAHSGSVEVEGFRAIVSFCHESFLRASHSLGWSPELVLLASWSHAHRLYLAIRQIRVPPSDISMPFRNRAHELSPEILDRAASGWDDVLHPKRTTTEGLLFDLVGYGSKSDPNFLITPAIFEALHELGVARIDDQVLPRPALLRDTTLYRNRLGSFLGNDRGVAYRHILKMQFTRLYSRNWLRRYVKNHLEQILKGIDISFGWTVIQAVGGHTALYPGLQNKIRNAVLQTDFNALFQREPQMTLVAIVGATSLNLWSTDSAARGHLENQICLIAKAITEVNSNAEDSDAEFRDSARARAYTLIDAAANLSVQRTNLEAAAEDFADLLGRMVTESEPMASILNEVSLILWNGLTPALSRFFTPLVVRMRGR